MIKFKSFYEGYDSQLKTAIKKARQELNTDAAKKSKMTNVLLYKKGNNVIHILPGKKGQRQRTQSEKDGWKPHGVVTHDNHKIMSEEKDPRIKSAGVQGFNKPKRTPGHPTKSHIVVAKDGSKIKTIRFGQQGAETAGDPKKGESDRMKKKRASFKARHGRNIAKGKMSAAYWADKVKW